MSTTEIDAVAAGAHTDAPDARDAPATTACVALVPVIASRPPARSAFSLPRPDPSFVVHLIAMAQASPQTRVLRRAAPDDVRAAYRSVANQNRPLTPGIRMRQVV